jgi:hypothetical protein
MLKVSHCRMLRHCPPRSLWQTLSTPPLRNQLPHQRKHSCGVYYMYLGTIVFFESSGKTFTTRVWISRLHVGSQLPPSRVNSSEHTLPTNQRVKIRSSTYKLAIICSATGGITVLTPIVFSKAHSTSFHNHATLTHIRTPFRSIVVPTDLFISITFIVLNHSLAVYQTLLPLTGNQLDITRFRKFWSGWGDLDPAAELGEDIWDYHPVCWAIWV